MTTKQVLSALRAIAREDKAAFLPGFFQVVPGGYGEGDRFLGCMVPDQRKVARQFCDLSQDELVKLFASPWHECRLTGMLILVGQFELAAKPKNPHRNFECQEIVEFYLANLDAVNNWDIVDTTAPQNSRGLAGRKSRRAKRSRSACGEQCAVGAACGGVGYVLTYQE